MKIGASLFPSITPGAIQSKKSQNTTSKTADEMAASKQTLKETIQRQIAEMEEARTNMGEDNPKAQRIIEKFKSGSKLTPDEMAYVRKNAPGMTDYIDRITRQREIFELSMKAAPSKADVQIVTIRISKQIEKHPNPEEKKILAKHLADAKHEYEQTEEYKNKPNTPLDKQKDTVKAQHDRLPKQNSKLALDAYQQAIITIPKISKGVDNR